MTLLSILACVGTSALRPCEDVLADLDAARADIQSCTTHAECGQPLPGTSCGCTRDLVARLDADPSSFYALLDQAELQECDVGFDSVCDCPEAYGFQCDAGTCAWDYASGTYLPDCRAESGATTEIGAATLDGDTLSVEVSYGGGCEAHTFTLCWPDQSFAESSPVQATLELYHDDGGDMCDAWMSETLLISLIPLKQAWEAAYGPGPGTTIVHIGGNSLTWSF